MNHNQSTHTKRTLTFSREAEACWTDAYNFVESGQLPGEYFDDVTDYASKIAENILRMAGLFHVIQGFKKDEISWETVNRAVIVCQWYAGEFTRLFSGKNEIPEDQADAQLIETWLKEHIQTRFCLCITNLAHYKINDILQRGPNSLRNKRVRIGAALDFLAFNDKLRPSAMGKTALVQLNPAFFNWSENNSRTMWSTHYQQPQLSPTYGKF